MIDDHGSWTRAQAVDFLDASRAWSPRSLLIEAMGALKAAGDERSVDADVLVTSSVTSSEEAREAPHRRRAADLGCGAGTEVLELLRHGFEVLAVDLHAECVEETRRRAAREGVDDRLETRVADLAGLELPRDRFDLVHAGFALPFCPRSAWPACWTAIARSVRVGGVFAGQFFGPHEPMMLKAASADVTVLDREEVANLRRVVPGIVWEALREEEIDRPGRGPRGEPKHWHVFHALWRRVA
ncbi:MAG: class I SAM-dependent methyltransferase [Planctomycetota bacterium]|jgi:SAM-dependent methyltransferase